MLQIACIAPGLHAIRVCFAEPIGFSANIVSFHETDQALDAFLEASLESKLEIVQTLQKRLEEIQEHLRAKEQQVKKDSMYYAPTDVGRWTAGMASLGTFSYGFLSAYIQQKQSFSSSFSQGSIHALKYLFPFVALHLWHCSIAYRLEINENEKARLEKTLNVLQAQLKLLKEILEEEK